jgi:selenocysteine-specific elongation factor
MIDIRLNLLPSAPRSIKFRDPVHFYLGTARVVGVVALLDRDELKPGETAIVQVHLDRPLVAHRQDRFIVRSYSPMTTIGGGLVIDPKPTKHKRFRDDVMQTLVELESGEKSVLLQKINEMVCCKVKELEQASGMGRERILDHLDSLAADDRVVQLGEQWSTGENVRAWERLMLETTRQFHQQNPLLPGIPLATLKGALPKQLAPKAFDALFEHPGLENSLVRQLDNAALPDFSPQPSENQMKLINAIEKTYREAGAQAKNRKEMLDRISMDERTANELLGFLFTSGKLVKLNDESYFHEETFDFAISLLREKFRGKEFSLAEFRDELGSARKAVQALLEYFDTRKYTMRKGDVRVVWKLPEA